MWGVGQPHREALHPQFYYYYNQVILSNDTVFEDCTLKFDTLGTQYVMNSREGDLTFDGCLLDSWTLSY